MLAALAVMRLLSYPQLRRLFFADRHTSALRQRLRVLSKDAVLTSWERTRARGTERYALPTAATLKRAASALRAQVAGGPLEVLVEAMLPTVRALTLTPDGDPKWLQHQREVNDLVVSIAAARPLAWMSTWNTPFAARAGIVELPQPDYVLVEDLDGALTLTFGEHDRGFEPLERFRTRKIEAYADLLRFPEVLAEHTGFTRFRVDVSVVDLPRAAPMKRLAELLTLARASAHPELFRFTLGGWLVAHPEDPTWFTAANVPRSTSAGWDSHQASRSLPGVAV